MQKPAASRIGRKASGFRLPGAQCRQWITAALEKPYDTCKKGISGLANALNGPIIRPKEKVMRGMLLLRNAPLSALIFAVWFVLSAPSAVLGAPDCAHWVVRDGVNPSAVEAFWKTATPDDVIRCLKAGADLDARDKLGWTPLHVAAGFGTADTVTALLNAGADLEARSTAGRTPLHVAAGSGTADTVTALLNAGADLEARSTDGSTPLHAAAGFGTADTVTALLKAGSDLETRDKDGWTPLHSAAGFGTADTVTALLKAGSDLGARSADGSTPLHLAAGVGIADAMTTLLDAGADPKARTKQGHRPIDFADERGRTTIGKLAGPAYWKLHDVSFD